MAELKVDKILPATGSSVSLSESGKTVLIPSGATLDASAATLSGIGARVDYCTSVQSSPFTAAAGKGYFINTGSAVTVTLPSSPSAGDEIIVIDSTGCASTNNITLGRNTNKIKGLCADATLENDREGVRIIYSGSSQGWITVTSSNSTAPDLTQNLYITATGGTVATCGNYKIHTFTSDGTFTVSCAGNSGGNDQLDYMVVAGGGGGGARSGGSGGGAGGFRESRNPANAPAWTASPLASTTSLTVTATSFPVTVGAGGTAGLDPAPSDPEKRGSNGSNSVFSTITSAGGGGGGFAGDAIPNANADGADGGSGAGGASNSPPAPANVAGSGNTPPVSPPQGNDGGTGQTTANAGGGSGGGGGAGAVGANSPALKAGGNGGAGVSTSISGSSVARSGGGGGGANGQNPGPSASPSPTTPGDGGIGGGGKAGGSPTSPVPQTGVSGTANTGGGGGGNGAPGYTAGEPAGAGGSGVVILRYKFQN